MRCLSGSALVLLLQSCTLPLELPSPPPFPAPETVVLPETETLPARPATPVAKPVTAAESLRARAVVAQENGDFAQALALLERAQRIAPRDGAIYRDMASAHRAAGREDLACQFARKGLSVPVDADVGDALLAQLDNC